MKKYELWKKCYRLYPKINCHGGDRVLKALSPFWNNTLTNIYVYAIINT